MSAICGIFNLDGRPVAPEIMDGMLSAMDYWGPDGSTVWREGPVAMGHLMLHSTPESVGDTLPRTSASGNLILTAHARLDNRGELFRNLNISPPERAKMPDSHLIMQAYEKWGQACPEHLIGDWCFGMWDKSRQTLFLARDHHGNTGIYYYQNARFFAFSSCLKGLFALPDVPRQPNPLRIAQILVSWPEHGEATCYQGIKRLPPAHLMTVGRGDVVGRQYWFLENTPALRLGSDQEYVEAFGEVYAEAVRCRMRSYRPVGVTLSGGLDSGSVAALAAREMGRTGNRLPAFSSVPLYDVTDLIPASRFGDESPFIEATSRHAGNIDVTYIRAADIGPVRGIERALELHDEPGHAAGNQSWIISLLQTVQARGIGALLTGQGGNATISWHAPGHLAALARNGRWRALRREVTAIKDSAKRPLWRLIAGRIVKPLLLDPLLGKYRRLRSAPEPWLCYSAINREFAREWKITERMCHSGHDPEFKTILDQREARFELIKPGKSINGFLWQESGAGFGLDVRDPTFDKRVMEFCLSIPDDQYVREGRDRWLIRRAMKDLMPAVVLDNKRRGLQAADIGRRMLAHLEETESTLQRIERSELAGHYLDISLMRRTLRKARRHLDTKVTEELRTIFFRGLMVGLFLLRFDGVVGSRGVYQAGGQKIMLR
jgi:asparagine synthase (glutamine-hydrolysing)